MVECIKCLEIWLSLKNVNVGLLIVDYRIVCTVSPFCWKNDSLLYKEQVHKEYTLRDSK